MNFEPQKLFIGLMDFFSILLPGALLTYYFMDHAGPYVIGRARYFQLEGATAVTAFLVSSYLVGHLVFLIAAGLLDDFYDRTRRRTLNSQIESTARTGKVLHGFWRGVLWVIFRQERGLAFKGASAIKEKALEPLHAQDAVNTFQWCKALLAKEHPESMIAVQRFEADSKFFRSFVVVIAILVLYWLVHWRESWLQAVCGSLVMLLALWRYMDQRFKSTNQAYWSVITFVAQQGKLYLKAAVRKDGLTHAGGVVFRKSAGQTEYLLVEAKKSQEKWLLPKGRIEEKELPREAAVRSVHEESGVWARIVDELDPITYGVGDKTILAKLFVMEYVAQGKRSSRNIHRQNHWRPLDAARKEATHPNESALLARADPLVVNRERRASRQ